MPRLSRDILAGFLIVASLCVGLMSVNWLRWIDRDLYDAQIAWLRTHAPSTLPQDVVVVGLDEAAFESIAEPYALWHKHLAALLDGLTEAGPSVVGIATPLPVRGYDFLIPGIDAPLVASISRLKARAPLVIGQPMGIGARLRPLAAPIAAAVGDDALASLALCEDLDGTVRRLHQRRCRSEEKREPLAHVMAKHLGRVGSPNGLIDYSAGGEIEYIPFQRVLNWLDVGRTDLLKSAFGGRVVVVASLLPTEVRYRLPVSLAAWERGSRTEPAAVVHVQALRSLMGRGLIERIADLELSVLAGLVALAWFGRSGWPKFALLLLAGAGILAASTYALWQGSTLHTGTLLACLLLAFLARLGWERMRDYGERKLLRSAFAGHVSPQVMRAILGGRLHPDGDGERSRVTVLFADIHGFTARNAGSTPEAMMALLNRYHQVVTAAIHSRGGTTDKLIGDGLMATFGLPQPLDAPERNALEAAQEILLRVAALNAVLRKEGQAPLEVGVGIHRGEVLAGYVGTGERRDFTVIGDPVQAAVDLEGLTRQAGVPVVCSHAVAEAVGFSGGLRELAQPSPPERSGAPTLPAWGWTPPLVREAP